MQKTHLQPEQIAWQRIVQQGLYQSFFETPTEVVAWNGAVQAQDYAGAKWAVAQRLQAASTEAAMEQCFNTGELIRTHVMRPTWHFVAPTDLRWMLALTAPRVHAANAYYYRIQELDAPLFAQSIKVMVKATEGHQHPTRPELAAALNQANIPTNDLRLTYLIMYAELEGILCSGPRRGKQFTYALVDERIPIAPTLTPDEALAALTKRYFISHGPALLKDFVWWSGLTVTAAKEGIALLGTTLHHEVINGQSYWSAATATLTPTKLTTLCAHLLPNYDEAVASYKDYSAAISPIHEKMWAQGNSIFSNYLVINGRIVGSWRRTLTKQTVSIEAKPFIPLSEAQNASLTTAAQRFGDYLGLTTDLRWV